ncbi:hypothetical protein HU200_024566 [Digitaria exilis]|uniref:Uncharacterized protein n=1 Tax=Digitaria exilis TaxID=1010633 RepID=A0A835EY75_9POAL|nr:hypothetical protein HU200_024566 [Digitaria exilis]
MSDLSSSPSPSSSSFALLCSTSFAAAPPQPPWLALHRCERYQEGRSNLEGTPMPVFASLACEYGVKYQKFLICRRRLLRLRLRLRLPQIPYAAGTDDSRPNPIDTLLSHGYSSAAPAGAALSEPCPATVSYLISCGLTPAAAAAHKLHTLSTEKVDAVRALLRSYGFTDAEIAGMAAEACHRAVLLMRSLDNHLLPCIQFLRDILGTDVDVCSAISGAPRAMESSIEKMRPAVAALRRLGLPEESISKLVILELGVLLTSPDRLSEIFEDLKALGLSITDTPFVYGIRALCGLSRETWLRKLALYQSFGVSEGELLRAFKKQPMIVLYSDENIKKKLRFLLDEVKLELTEVMRLPLIIGFSLEKNTKPRCAVLSVLMREGKIDPSTNVLSPLLASAKAFSERFVLRYADDVPDVVKAYEGKIIFEGFRDQDVLVPLKS